MPHTDATNVGAQSAAANPTQPVLAPWLAQLPPSAPARLAQYVRLLEQWGKTYNLTAVRDEQAVWVQHIADSLAAWTQIKESWSPPRKPAAAKPTVLDVGSGAGLPGLVWAIAEPGWALHCIDAVAKKAAFMRQAVATLELTQASVHHGRVERLEPGMGGVPAAGFDLITARAFASLADFTMLTRHLLAEDGLWCAMKGRRIEVDAEATALVASGVEVFHVEPLVVPGLSAQRCLVWMRPQLAATTA